jgi:hypothetical protein
MDKYKEIKVVLSEEECRDFQEALKLAIYRQGQSKEDFDFLCRAVYHHHRLQAFLDSMAKGEGGNSAGD